MCKRQLFAATMLLGMLLCMVWPPFACATVNATSEGAAAGNTIYVAGNPDAYPVEYYNKDSGLYEGIMPALLEEVSKDTGLNFTYIKASSVDHRAQLATNCQVEVVSACTGNEAWIQNINAVASQPIMSLQNEKGQTQNACLVFTEIANPEMVQQVESTIVAASQDHLASIAVDFMMTHPVQKTPVLFYVMPVLLVVLTVALVIVVLRARKYRKDNETANQIDFRTGIYNKAHFIQFYETFIPEMYRNLYAVIYIAFNIEHVNEHYSEEMAESQLCFAANELKLSVRDNEAVARVSAGGFGIVRFCGSEKDAIEWTNQTLERLNSYHQYDNRINADASAMFYGGIYMLEPSDRDCEKVLFKAQKGFVKAAQAGVPCMVTSQDFLVQEAKEQVLKREMMDGIRNGQFKMYLQFGVYAKDGTICGAEAFSRWDHPTRGVLHPGQYIPLMETHGAITELDFFIFEEACRTLEKWTLMGHAMVISCNFARRSIEQVDFVQRIEAVAARYNFERRLLLLEISESAMDRNHALTFENITKCKSLGFSVALDDVGHSTTDLSDFRYEAVTLVKLDRSLLNAAVTPRGEALLRGLVKMMHEMGIQVLCEGAETEQQFKLLQAIDCDYIQGYYFYHPLPLIEAERVLKDMDQQA